MATTGSVINDMVSGDDFEVERTYTLDGSFTITTASLAIQTRIGAPTTPQGAGTETPIFLTINSTPSTYGVITDDGSSSGQVVLDFILPNAITGLLSSITMYFFGIQLTTSTGQIYTPETGSWTPQRGI